MTIPFRVGDRVQWALVKTRKYKRPIQSKMSFSQRAKEPAMLHGTVVELVPAGQMPANKSGLPAKNHDSCIVRTKNGLRWPPMARVQLVA